MSTPGPENAVLERASTLAETARNALHAARTQLGQAADATRELDQTLRRAEGEITELPYQASKMEATGQAGPFLQNAQSVADGIDRRLEAGGRLIGEIRDRFDSATVALRAGREALTELGQLPVEHDRALMDRLSYRINALDGAVDTAREGIDATDRRIGRAQESLGELIGRRESSPGFVRDTATDVDRDLMNTRSGLREVGRDIDDAEPAAAGAAQDAELARAFHAGAYQTAKADQRHQPAAGDEAHKPQGADIASRLRGL